MDYEMKINFPEEWQIDEWYGGLRHKFEIDGHSAWFVEPENSAGDGRWTWCMVWPEAFVERVVTPVLPTAICCKYYKYQGV